MITIVPTRRSRLTPVRLAAIVAAVALASGLYLVLSDVAASQALCALVDAGPPR